MRITAAFDPVTRIEGHLNIEITIDTVNGLQQVVEAKAIGGLFRGFEKLLIGRDPRDAQHITERICGVCPVAHGMASVRALDAAFGVTIPENARLLRNLVNGSNFVESHILHFYLLCLADYIQGPAKPPWQADWPVDRRFSQADNDRLMQHYLQALTIRRKADQMTAVFGGKIPHPPTFVPGGFTANPRPERINEFKALLGEVTDFIRTSYLPDVQLLAETYSEYATLGQGLGHLMAFGAFDLDGEGGSRLFDSGVSWHLSTEPEALTSDAITEHVRYAWFRDAEPLHPSQAKTEPQNPKSQAYTWLKAPRYEDQPLEVGPLARMWISGRYQEGISVLDRHLARALEAETLALAMADWVDQLNPDGPVYTEHDLPNAATAQGLTEAPRGALGHWIEVAAGKIAHYQIISPTTWNVSGRDDRGVPGPLEQALLGIPVENADQPLEVMRVIHSFDPCLDCATHVIRPKA
jgi:hydrogenase large subunit